MTRIHHLRRTVNVHASTVITAADPAVVTTAANHGMKANGTILLEKIEGTMADLVMRRTAGATPRPVKYTRLSNTTFSLQDLDGTDIDTTGLAHTAGKGSVKMDDPDIEWDCAVATTWDPMDLTQGFDTGGVGLSPAIQIALAADILPATGVTDVQIGLFTRPSNRQEWRAALSLITFATAGNPAGSWITDVDYSMLHIVDVYTLPQIQWRTTAVGSGTNSFKLQCVAAGGRD